MSKERARRREAREREAAERSVVREAAARRRARNQQLLAPILAPVRRLRPASSRWRSSGRPTGVLAAKRAKRLRLLIIALVLLQVFVWMIRPDWEARLGALVLTLFCFPVFAAFTL